MSHGIQTTVVEIDPVVHQYATQYFNLPTNHTAVIEDAVTFVDDLQRKRLSQEKFDYIIHDVFTGGAEPLELFTLEFLKGLSYLLSSDGIIAIVGQVYHSLLMKSDMCRIMAAIYCSNLPYVLSKLSRRSSPDVASSEKKPHQKTQS